jgi:hypothetical protein
MVAESVKHAPHNTLNNNGGPKYARILSCQRSRFVTSPNSLDVAAGSEPISTQNAIRDIGLSQ